MDLAGGFNPSEKYGSIGMSIPHIWTKKTCSERPTSIILHNKHDDDNILMMSMEYNHIHIYLKYHSIYACHITYHVL